MSINRISIIRSLGKVFSKTKKILGMKGENLQEVLLFDLDKKIEGNAIVEIELPDGAQSFVELTETEEGYELPVKSVLTEQVGFVKFQLRILQNKVEVFKSEIFELEVKESLNAIYEEPEEYPTWLDKLEDLQTELNNSEKERVANENERIGAEESRKENFKQMQESVNGAIRNIKDLTENYNLNATEKTNKFDENYTEKKKAFDDNYSETLKSFNDNAETKYDNYNKNAENKTSEYNKNNDEKLKAYNDNHTTKITNFDTNAQNKTDEYNSNASKKLDDYNSNDTTKTEKYNENATTKLSDYNSNTTAKKKEYDTNAENKIVEFNNNATEKLDEYNQNAESLTNRVIECESENERLRNDIKSIAVVNEVSGENIHIEDSSDARCELEIGGNQKQDTREGYNQFKITSTSTKSAGITITKVDESSVSYQGTTTGLFTHILVEYDGNGLEITKQMYLKAFGNLTNAILSVKLIKNGKTESSYVRVSPNLILSAGDVLQQIYVQQQNTGILVSGTLQVLLTDYENKDKPYEQYGASPSLDYPSPVKSVGDNVNLFPGWEMGTIDVATGNKITDPYYIRSVDFIPILPNIDYTLYQINSFGFDSLNTALRLYDKDKKYLGNQYLGEILVKSFAFKISNPSVRFMIPTSTNGQTNVIPKNAKVDIKLEKGIIATPYSPYNYGSAKVDIKNENIFNTENVKSTSEVSVVDNKNGLLKLQGVNGFWKGITTTQKFETGKRVYVKCKVVEGTGSSGNIGIKDTNGDDILENYKVSNNLISCSFISKGITKIFFRCNGTSNNGNIKYSDIMFSYEDIDYVPNQEQSYLVDVQQPMFEGDTFVKQDGKWYEKHNWKTMSFDGQNMGSQAGGSFADFKENGNIVRVFEIKDLLISSVRNDIFCDKLPRQADSMWNGKSTGIQSWQGQNKILISLPFDDVEKKYGQKLTVDNYVTAFYMYLQDEVLIISYLLAEPKLLECTEAQSKVLDEIYNKAHTYKNITNISAESSEVNPIINVKYLKDAEIEHKKLQTQIDEIKQLLSTTETSALLVNNLEKDLRMEVE